VTAPADPCSAIRSSIDWPYGAKWAPCRHSPLHEPGRLPPLRFARFSGVRIGQRLPHGSDGYGHAVAGSPYVSRSEIVSRSIRVSMGAFTTRAHPAA